MLVAQGKSLGIGQGRLAADVANFAAVTKAFTPILYGFAARFSVRYPFFVAAAMFAIANAIFATLSNSSPTMLSKTYSWARLPRSEDDDKGGVHRSHLTRMLRKLSSFNLLRRSPSPTKDLEK